MNKQGIMVKFLVSIILAIIIFAPACAISSKFFRLSSQAQDNFNTLVKDIQDLSTNGNSPEIRNELLILDEETAMAYFSASELKVEATTKDGESYFITFSRPSICDGSYAGCICLIRKANLLEEGDNLKIIPNIFNCKNLDFEIVFKEDNCAIGIRHEDIRDYSCEGGFFADRKLISQEKDDYYQNQRRINLVVEKKGEQEAHIELYQLALPTR